MVGIPTALTGTDQSVGSFFFWSLLFPLLRRRAWWIWIGIDDCAEAGIKFRCIQCILFFNLFVNLIQSVFRKVREELINALLCRLETIQYNLLFPGKVVDLDFDLFREIHLEFVVRCEYRYQYRYH